MKYVFTIVLALISMSGVLAQGITVSGTVYEAAGGPLPGVNVVVKNTTIGTVSDFDGNFMLTNRQVGDVLVFSYLGYISTEVVVRNADPISVTMQEDVSALDEVVVVGYGTSTKREITGAVAVVGSETIEELNPQRIEQALQGQVAGVQITSESGSPGSGSNIRIRGISTNGDNRPLILVDGKPSVRGKAV